MWGQNAFGGPDSLDFNAPLFAQGWRYDRITALTHPTHPVVARGLADFVVVELDISVAYQDIHGLYTTPSVRVPFLLDTGSRESFFLGSLAKRLWGRDNPPPQNFFCGPSSPNAAEIAFLEPIWNSRGGEWSSWWCRRKVCVGFGMPPLTVNARFPLKSRRAGGMGAPFDWADQAGWSDVCILGIQDMFEDRMVAVTPESVFVMMKKP